MKIAICKKKLLESTLKVYENERETLKKYEDELMLRLYLAAIVPSNKKIDKVGRCLAELVMAQTECVNSLKNEAEKYYFQLSEVLKKSA